MVGFHFKKTIKRLIILVSFCIISALMHFYISSLAQDLLGDIVVFIIFSSVIIYDYKSLFTLALPRLEYTINIFFILIFTILMFATLYNQPINNETKYFLEHGKEVGLTYSSALYFSAMTLATVGYGDIVPLGYYRFFAIIEAYMGLVYVGTMIYLLTHPLHKH